MPNFVQRHQSRCLPRDWLPEDDLAHFVIEAVERVPLERFQVNAHLGAVSPADDAGVAGVLANGIFGSRRIERATYHWRSVRGGELSSGPRHDLHVPAQQLRSGSGGVPAGTAAGEGTEAAACWDGERGRHEGGREREAQQHPLTAGALREQLRGEIEGLFAQHGRRAGPAGSAGGRGRQAAGEAGPSCAELERRAQARGQYERKVAARERRTGSRRVGTSSAGGEGADQPDGRQCADAQEPAP